MLKNPINTLEDRMIYIPTLMFHYLMLYLDEKLKFSTLKGKLKLRFLKELRLDKKFVFDENDFEKKDYSAKGEI
jgi:hypothetical protein